MNYLYDALQFLFFMTVLTCASVLLGKFFAAALNGTIIFRPENKIYKNLKIDPGHEMLWTEYLYSVLVFTLVSFMFLFLLQILQDYLPLNPQGIHNVEPVLAFNTAVSFITNTNWQAYSGETTLSYLVQMTGLTVQNFLSAAAGISVLAALIRSIKTRQGKTIGNFWTDLTRSVIYILLPLSVIVAFLLISQGVVQNFNSYTEVSTIENSRQVIPMGPAASQIAIKQLGTNGGGFFGANSAFPFENPSGLSGFIELLAILLIPGALVFTYGYMLGNIKHAWMLYGAMVFLFCAGAIISYWSEISSGSLLRTGALMEGKEIRFGVFNSILWSAATTAASNGSVNAAMSSLSPLSGMVAMLNMQLGEIVFGGVGSGLYGMILFVLLTVFISGLMVGRTPEYFGKKIGAFEIKWTITGILIPGIAVLFLTAAGTTTNAGLSGRLNGGPHGLSEILYAFTSAANNNGSSFAGLNANTLFYNLTLAFAMMLGRFGVIIPVLAIAGSLVKKNITPESAGTLSTNNLLFGFLLLSVILIVGALTFFPVLSIGPVLEHLLTSAGFNF